MKEITDIVNAFDEAIKQGKKTALATVVSVEGSAYRRAGARMLITEDGQLTGAISGGCLEGDALRKARLVILQQEPLLVTYDTTDDDDAKLGVGLGCNGIIHILIEPVSDKHDPIRLLKVIVASKQPAVLVTLFSVDDRKARQPGTCLGLTNDGVMTANTISYPYAGQLLADANEVLNNKRSEHPTYTDGVIYTAFVEYIKPTIALVVIGAGNDAIPLTRIAAVLGWDTTVMDGRQNYLLAERFPQANRLIVARPEEVLQHLQITEWTAFVLMTHNYNYEQALLAELIPLGLPYIGVLGPRKKLERMLDELQSTGMSISDEQRGNLYGPTGLDIGSEGADEIALSIVAEIKAVLSSRNGASLKYKQESIHATDQ
ncbi:XdhC family protein [Mucilaginibacter antarcticus]|uniref:XdhC family protein n=1 Tax=Mucilaginibacter antarcticus TaxID=1855725 RepID=A0ABW5XVB8_9SPHI